MVDQAREPYALVLLAGEEPSSELLRELSTRSSYLLCADSAVEYARQAGVAIDAVVGDLDSVSEDTLRWCNDSGIAVIHIEEQETIDFEKTLQHLLTFHTGGVIVLGLTGKRTDHMLTNFSVMLKYTDSFTSLVAIESSASHRFLTTNKRQATLDLPPGSSVSLTPFGVAHGVRTTNLKYPLSDEPLHLGLRSGSSNEAAASPVVISIESGSLLITINED